MNDLAYELNCLFVETFRIILKVEEAMLKRSGGHNLSISELHMLEAIGKNANEAKTVGEIAQLLNISMPSVTIAVGKLVKKGLTVKTKADRDGRSVHVSLTPLGQRVDRMHQRFHEKMVNSVTGDMDENERTVLLTGVSKLNRFFRRKLETLELED